MPTRDEVVRALEAVDEPLLHRPLPQLGMVRAVDVQGPRVRITVGLVIPEHPGVTTLQRDIIHAVEALEGVEVVEVGFAPMDDDERRALRDLITGIHGPAGTSPLQDPNTRTRIIAVASGKGGVGKSSVTVNLAIQLAQLGKRTAVIDADVWGFSIPAMLGVDRPPFAIDELLVPPEAYGVTVISIGFFVREDQPVIWRGPMLHKALQQFVTDVYWGDPDYLVIDMPPGTGDVSLSVAQFLPRAEVVVVTTPQPAAQRVAQRAAQMARKVNLSVLGVVENMSWFTGDDGTRYEIFGSGGGQALADALRVPLLGQIPLEPVLRQGGDVGRPISATHPDSEVARGFARIAARIDELGPRRRRNPALKVTSG